MRLLWGFLALASCLCALVEAGLTESAALLPACGLKCTIAAIGESTCSLTNETCICTNQELISSISVCVQSSCTVKEQLSTLFPCHRYHVVLIKPATKNVSDTACGVPVRDVSHLIDGFGVGGCVVTLLFFIARIVSRLTLGGFNFGMDDYTITAAMVSAAAIRLKSTFTDMLGLSHWFLGAIHGA